MPNDKKNKKSMVSHKGRTLLHEFLLKMESAGLNDKLARMVVDSRSNNLAKRIVKLIEDEFKSPINQERARQIIRGVNLSYPRSI